MAWTPEEARYALDRLIARRKIRPSDVDRALGDRQKEIQSLRQRLAELESLGGLRRAAPRRSGRRRPAVKKPVGRRKPKISARRRSQLRLQGKYMGYVRRLTAAQKAEVKKARQEKGWQAAIRMAANLAKAGSSNKD